MNPHHKPIQTPPADNQATRPDIRAEASLATTVKHLWPYIWPSDRADLKARVLGAMALLLVAKFITIAVAAAARKFFPAAASRRPTASKIGPVPLL